MLLEYAGSLAVYGDVDRKLAAGMARMKQWCEAADWGVVSEARREDWADIRALPWRW